MKINGLFKSEEKQPKKTLDDFIKKDDENIDDGGIEKEKEEISSPEKEKEHIVINKLTENEFFLQGGENEPKWLAKCAKVWYAVMSLMWFLLSCMTYSPILFISDKIHPMVKNKKLSLIYSAIIYSAIVVVFMILIFVRRTPTI